MEDAERLARAFEQAAMTIYSQAAEAAEQGFQDWPSTYLWFAEHDQPHLVELEMARLALWLKLAREAGVPAEKLPDSQQLASNWEQATLIFGSDPRPGDDSGLLMSRGGERQVAVARQLHDPQSPLNCGIEDFLDFRYQD